MNSDWVDAAKAMLGVTAWAYGHQPKEPPTVEELTSELEAVKASHQHANRALTNMSVALSDAMDRCVAYAEELRKMKLAHQKEIKALSEEIEHLNTKLKGARVLADAAEKTLADERASAAVRSGGVPTEPP